LADKADLLLSQNIIWQSQCVLLHPGQEEGGFWISIAATKGVLRALQALPLPFSQFCLHNVFLEIKAKTLGNSLGMFFKNSFSEEK